MMKKITGMYGFSEIMQMLELLTQIKGHDEIVLKLAKILERVDFMLEEVKYVE